MNKIFLNSVLEPNPDLVTVWQKGQGSSSKIVKSYVQLDPDNLKVWSAFSFANITSAYRHVIHTRLSHPPSFRPTRSMRTMGPEQSMRNIVLTWCKDRVNEGMKRAARVIQQNLGQPEIEPSLRVEEVNVKKNHLFTKNLPKELQDRPGNYVRPDSYVMGLVELQRGPIYMPVEIKPSSIWRSSMFEDGTDEDIALQPLRQLGTYCKNCDTRIGVILTPDEAVAVRYYDIDEWEVGCHYMPVPWSNSGHRLTVNLTIWACAVLSLNDEYHHIVPRLHLFPEINTWQEGPRKGYYQHLYSGRFTTKLPVGAVVIAEKPPSGEVPERVVVNIGSTDEDILKGQRRIAAQQKLRRISLLGVKSGDSTKRKASAMVSSTRKVARVRSDGAKKKLK